LLEQVEEGIEPVMGDGAYDQGKCYAGGGKRRVDVIGAV
jgi:hypothetical protein